MISPPQERVRLAAKSYKGRKPSLTKERVEEIRQRGHGRRAETGPAAEYGFRGRLVLSYRRAMG
jgi:hypothetical protein